VIAVWGVLSTRALTVFILSKDPASRRGALDAICKERKLEGIVVKNPIRWLVFMTVPLATHGLSFAIAGEPNAPHKKLKIVVFGGHPDDPESGAGGLIATLTRHGHEVICAYGTSFRGDRLGSQ
jgi:hypothetical protein